MADERRHTLTLIAAPNLLNYIKIWIK
jgi:hypothetical protein